jgi:prepilin-type N-terminal cleavage/methylation domain-containing protein
MTRTSVSRRRRGLTIVELIVVLALLGIIGGMVVSVLIRQQRFQRAMVDVAESRARMRDIATIIPTDLRGASSIGGDLLDIGLTSLQFRASVGTSILCSYGGANVIDLPPAKMASGTVLTSWINPPKPGDIAFIYDDGTAAGNVDDTWTPFTITDTTSATNPAWCSAGAVPAFAQAADDGQRRYRITLSAAPNPARVRVGAPIRFAREVRYSLYAAADANWFVGYETCTPAAAFGTPGVCANREVLAGPVRAASADTTASGLYFLYYRQDGTLVTNAAQAGQIARVGIGLRTSPLSLLQATRLGGNKAGRDSLRLTVAVRNRI